MMGQDKASGGLLARGRAETPGRRVPQGNELGEGRAGGLGFFRGRWQARGPRGLAGVFWKVGRPRAQ